MFLAIIATATALVIATALAAFMTDNFTNL